MDSTFIKLLVLLLTSFWWFPVLRTLFTETWRVSIHDGSRAGQPSEIPGRANRGLEAESADERGLENSAWAVGRHRPVRHDTSFPTGVKDPERIRRELPTAFPRSRK